MYVTIVGVLVDLGRYWEEGERGEKGNGNVVRWYELLVYMLI